MALGYFSHAVRQHRFAGRVSARETWFIAWVGLRGAVPVVLALFPLMAGIPQAGVVCNIAFLVVVTSLMLQGTTIGLVARRPGVAMPDADDAVRTRAVLRDFALDASTPAGAICAFYNLPAVEHPHQALGEWMASELRRPPVAGDNRAASTITNRGLGPCPCQNDRRYPEESLCPVAPMSCWSC